MIKSTFIIFILLLIFNSCSKSNKISCGNYYTSKPSTSQKKHLLNIFGKNYFKYAPSMMFVLNCDSTFKYGFCNKLISNNGTWSIKGEFLVLNRYLTKDTMFLYYHKDLFLFPYYDRDSIGRTDTMYAILTKKGTYFKGKLSDSISPKPK